MKSRYRDQVQGRYDDDDDDDNDNDNDDDDNDEWWSSTNDQTATLVISSRAYFH